MRKLFHLLFVVLACLFCGTLLSHYLEPLQMKTFLQLRNLYYFSNSTSKEAVNGVIYSKYKGMDSIYFNPVNFVQSIWPDIYAVLSANVDSSYFKKDNEIKVDTSRIILYSEKIMNFVDTVVLNGNNCYRLVYDFPENSYSIPSGWYSGMAQGHASELMIAAFCLTNDSIYLKNAECFINLLDINVENGGVKELVNGGIWFEEYAKYDVTKKSPLVLNGHIFAIDGLYALTKVSTNPKYHIMLQNSISALEMNIQKYIVGGFWSYYDLYVHPSIADYSYHNIHIEQLKRLIELNKINSGTDIPMITSTYQHFQLGKIIPTGIFVRLVYMHNNMLLFMVVINSIFSFGVYLLCIYFYNRKKHDKSLPFN